MAYPHILDALHPIDRSKDPEGGKESGDPASSTAAETGEEALTVAQRDNPEAQNTERHPGLPH